MRIVAVQTGLEPDSVLGGEITDREFLTRLAERGAEIHVLAAESHPIVEHTNIYPHYYGARLPQRIPYRSNVDVAIDIRRLLLDLRPVDWVRYNSPYAVGLGTVVGARGERIWGSYLHCEDFRLWKWIDSFLPGHSDLNTCLSEDTRADVIARCPRANGPQTVVVPLGVDTRPFDEACSSGGGIRADLDIPSDAVVILFVGVAIPRKGIAELIHAWSQVRSLPGVHMVAIAKPVAVKESDMLRDMAREDRRFHYRERVQHEHIPQYFSAADIFFFPTRREGFGLVVGEAMASRLPVVTTSAPGVRSVIRPGITALTTPVGDVDGMARNLRELIKNADLRDQLGNAGRERLERSFSWGPIMDSLMGYLQQ